jgi:uncharacterized protein
MQEKRVAIMIIDFHTHKHPKLEASMEKAGVGKAVLLMPLQRDLYDSRGNIIFNTAEEVIAGNWEVVDATMNSDKFFPFAWVAPKMPDALARLDEFMTYGCSGIKLHPVLDNFSLLDSSVSPIIDFARRFEIPVMIHTGWRPAGNVSDVAILAKANADVKFVIAHMKEEWGLNGRKSHMDVASRNDNVWLECSYVEHPRRLGEAVEQLGAERILFGSDYPFGNGDISWDLTKVTAAPISDRDKRKILEENPARLLRA